MADAASAPTTVPPGEDPERAGLREVDEVLTSRSVVFVTGKGGVGKSGVAAALALRARTLGLTPLLFECDAPTRPSLFPGGGPVTGELREVVPGILALNQNSDDAVHQYALASLPSRALADLLFENRVARLFLKASPSVNEMALIGRIVQLVEAHESQGPVVVDLHATGHALAMLRAPDGIMRVLRGGPVYERAKKVRDIIFDEGRCSIVTVAHPEELPVTELLEFHDELEAMGAPLGPVIVNGVFDDPAPGIPDEILSRLIASQEEDVARAARDAAALRSWARRSRRERDRLAEGVSVRGIHVVSMPYVCDLAPAETLAGRLSDVLDERGSEGARV